MASTNKTTNVLLSQFLGTDHFSFLTDYNGDMLKIDTYCGNLKALIDGTSSKAEQNTESIQNVQSDIQSIQSVQERQNTNITNNTNDITQLKEKNVIIEANINKNTQDITELKNGMGDAIYLPTTKTDWNLGETTVKFYYIPTTKTVYVTSIGTSPLNAGPGVSLSGTFKVDISKITDSEITARLQKGRPITVNGGWVSCRVGVTIDGVEQIIPTLIPLTIFLYGDGTSNTITVSIGAEQRTPLGGLISDSTTLLIEGSIPMSIYI